MLGGDLLRWPLAAGRSAFRAHLLEKKASKRTRRLGRGAELLGGDKKHVERLLGRR